MKSSNIRGAVAPLILSALTMICIHAHAVDGVVLIDQSRALAGNVTTGDSAGFPVTISRPGSYRLAGNLTPGDGEDAVVITASDVTLDLNGFTIQGTGVGKAVGVRGDGFGSPGGNITVSNGTIRDMGDAGIRLGALGQIDKVRVLSNGNEGITLGRGSSVRDSEVVGNKGSGITANGRTLINHSVIALNGSYGILFLSPNGFGAYSVTNSVIVDNKQEGLGAGTVFGNAVVGYGGNVLNGNNNGGQQVSGALAIQTGANVCTTSTVCP
jgi:hypothetical protein